MLPHSTSVSAYAQQNLNDRTISKTKPWQLLCRHARGPDTRFSFDSKWIKMLSTTYELVDPPADTIYLNTLRGFVHCCAIRNNSCLRKRFNPRAIVIPHEYAPVHRRYCRIRREDTPHYF